MFKELINDLMIDGWRVYSTKDLPPSFLLHLDTIGKRRLLRFMVYDDKPFVFVKTVFLKIEKKKDDGK